MFSSPEILEYHRKLLDLPLPWEVRSVDVNVEKLAVTIDVYWPAQTFAPCPLCQQLCSLKDSKTRLWRHLDTMQFKTLLRCDVPRVDCPEHGVLQVFLPWSDPRSRFTALFEKMAAEILLSCKNQTQAAGLLRISWKQVHLIQWRAVEKALAMDMWDPYKTVVEKQIPNADIVHDRFHITGYLTKAVDAVRKTEHRDFMKAGIEILKGTKYLWLTNQNNWNNWNKKQKSDHRELKGICLKVGRAFTMKEAFRNFWAYTNKGSAENFLDKWYFWATHSRLKPIIEAARTLKRHIGNMLTYFKHPITNAASEGLNSKIQLIKADARGFRNYENFRVAILFHCGGFKYSPLKRA